MATILEIARSQTGGAWHVRGRLDTRPVKTNQLPPENISHALSKYASLKRLWLEAARWDALRLEGLVSNGKYAGRREPRI
jgi:hypothetical protein